MSRAKEFGGAVSIGSLPGAVAAFFRWWGQELAACIPGGLRSALRRRRGTLIVALGPQEAVLRFRKPGATEELGRVPFDPAAPETARAVVGDLAARVGRLTSETVLVLPESLVLRRVVELPLAARENLREVLSFEMDRYTPFSAEEVLYDWRILSDDSEAQTVSVDLAVVPLDAVARAEACARSWGLGPDIVRSADDREGTPPETGFVFRRPAARRSGFAGRLAVALWVCAVALAVALVMLPLQRQEALLALYEARLDESRFEAVAVDALRRQVQEIGALTDLLTTRKTARPAAVGLLHEITRLLPDDTWLLQLRVSGDQLTMAGYSGAASALIPVLEGSDLLAEVRFEAPVTLDARIGLERFNLSAEVTGDAGGGS